MITRPESIKTGKEPAGMNELIGKNVLVRSVTHYYTGKLSAADSEWLQLDEAAWIADTGRFSEALKDGSLNEVEPYPGTCWVSAGAIVDICQWPHELPRTMK
jgi:hypothetical protein